MSCFSTPIAEQIWDMKYRLKSADGAPLDHTVEDSWRRVADALERKKNILRHGATNFMLHWRISSSCLPGAFWRGRGPGAV